ncbi:hypothetical protein ACFQ88_33345 [Paenibacillus sp. NPDC056579]|uniref:hypothetical protein n=1 Tax=unclassified Paenibacillus TaxID=185978 RepID=UPI001EF972F8|nr:hypothetical protein [Paenibacillus sp. H1-7]ULL13628.1 hypothetical protein DVH26_03685 [Paenibacillus sp. H1-7]
MNNHSPIVYHDKKYGFQLVFPRWWKNYVVIRRDKGDPTAEYVLHFKFKYKGKLYDDVLTILVLPITFHQWMDEGYSESPLTFLGEYEGRVFASLTPEALPDAFLDPQTKQVDYKKYGIPIRLLNRMVNDDDPRILRSIRFPKQVKTFRSNPVRSRRVWRYK